MFVITSSATSSFVYTGEPNFSRDASKAKTYATAAAAKRAISKAETVTGRSGLAVRTMDEVAPAPVAPAKAVGKAPRKKAA